MKLLTKEEEAEHYNATIKGGIGGGLIGLTVGTLGVLGAQRRFPSFNHLTLPLKAFLVTSAGTFSAIVSADKYSRAFEQSRNPEQEYHDDNERARADYERTKPFMQRAKDFGWENRYPIVFGSWVASMAGSLALVGRNPYLSTAQKIVQARVYAQGLTVAILIITAAFEIGDRNKGEGRWETIKVLDPKDPEHKRLVDKKVHHERYAGEDMWRDMVEAEEEKMKERKQAIREKEDKDRKAGKKPSPGLHEKNVKKAKKEQEQAEEDDDSDALKDKPHVP